jgi:hypothetical protein
MKVLSRLKIILSKAFKSKKPSNEKYQEGDCGELHYEMGGWTFGRAKKF